MPLIRWSPTVDPFGDYDEMFNHLPSVMGGKGMQAFVPAINMYETDQAVVVETPLAGVKLENVEVSVQNGILTLKGENKSEHVVEEKNYYRKEVRSGEFYRQIPLPTAVLEDKVSAEFEDGLLRITCPKSKAEDKGNKISVKIVNKKNK